MFRRIKWEISWLSHRIAVIGLGAFLSALGGILLWINGGSGWYVLHSYGSGGHAGSLSSIFIIWLFVYALYGICLALHWAGMECTGRESRHVILHFAGTAFAYLLDLVWYALFFCTRLTVFSLIVLVLAAVLNIMVLLFPKRGLILQKLLGILILSAEIGFIWFTVSFLLLN